MQSKGQGKYNRGTVCKLHRRQYAAGAAATAAAAAAAAPASKPTD